MTVDDPGIDTSVPHSARIWNYWLGGTDNYPVDQAAGDQFSAIYPGIVDIARADRAFLGRVVRYLAGQAGVRQFLDVGAGLPTAVNTHEAANQVTPDARTVYVDNDPLVVTHAEKLLATGQQSKTHFVNASMDNPDEVLREAARWLDLAQPVGLTLMGVLGHVTDYAAAKSIVTGLLAGLPPGSYLAINDSIDTSEALEQALRVYEASGAVPYRTRSLEEFTGYFDGLELVEPGVVLVDDWRPEPGVLRGPDIPQVGAVGRKRASLCSRIRHRESAFARVYDFYLGGTDHFARTYRQAGIPAQARTAREFAALAFGGLDLADPGVVLVSDWHPPAAPGRRPPKSTGTAGSAASPPLITSPNW